MKEAIKTVVMKEFEADFIEAELEIIFEDDVLAFLLDGEELFSGDWSGNFTPIFKRALEIWDFSHSSNQTVRSDKNE